MARPKGGRTVLVRITYDTIGELAGGIAGDTARQYAQRGQFDSRSLDSLLTWINVRRTEMGLPLIGLPTDNAFEAETHSDADAPKAVTNMFARTETGSPLIYHPMTASYRVNDT